MCSGVACKLRYTKPLTYHASTEVDITQNRQAMSFELTADPASIFPVLVAVVRGCDDQSLFSVVLIPQGLALRKRGILHFHTTRVTATAERAASALQQHSMRIGDKVRVSARALWIHAHTPPLATTRFAARMLLTTMCLAFTTRKRSRSLLSSRALGIFWGFLCMKQVRCFLFFKCERSLTCENSNSFDSCPISYF